MRERDNLSEQALAKSTYDTAAHVQRDESDDFPSQLDTLWPREQMSASITTFRAKLRSQILILAHLNAVISLDRRLNEANPAIISKQAILAAQETIRLITEDGKEGIVKCIWMWLYYSFSAVVVLFLFIIHNPLQNEAALNCALISDVESMCTDLASSSPGAARIAEACKEMGKLGFEVMKLGAKRKARKRQEPDPEPRGPRKEPRLEGNPEEARTTPGLDQREPFEGTEEQQALPNALNLDMVPETFAWDQWEQWLQDVEWPNPDTS